MVLQAVIRLAERYAESAEALSDNEGNARRKLELKRIAEACRWTPANRPDGFYQAMQSLWFNQLLSAPTSTHNLGRFDQYMYPFYKKDIEECRITDEEVINLLCELRIKCMRPENIKLSGAKRSQHAGFAKWIRLCVHRRC